VSLRGKKRNFPDWTQRAQEVRLMIGEEEKRLRRG